MYHSILVDIFFRRIYGKKNQKLWKENPSECKNMKNKNVLSKVNYTYSV